MSTTTKAAHTPGPWTLSDNGRGYSIPEIRVAWMHSHSTDERDNERIQASESGQCEKANALLIAAAPEMLEALECAETVLFLLSEEAARLGCRGKEVLPKIKASIQKAKGGL